MIYTKETAKEAIDILVARKKMFLQRTYLLIGVFGIIGGAIAYFFGNSDKATFVMYFGLSIGILMIILAVTLVPRIYKNYKPYLENESLSQ